MNITKNDYKYFYKQSVEKSLETHSQCKLSDNNKKNNTTNLTNLSKELNSLSFLGMSSVKRKVNDNNTDNLNTNDLNTLRNLVNTGKLNDYLQSLDEPTLKQTITNPQFVKNSIIITKEKLMEEITKINNKDTALTLEEEQKKLELLTGLAFFSIEDIVDTKDCHTLIPSIVFTGAKYTKKPSKEFIDKLIEESAQTHATASGLILGGQQVVGVVAGLIAGIAAAANPAGGVTGPAAGMAVYSGTTSLPVDSGVLSCLTINLIDEICNAYGVENTAAKGIFITSALVNLTCKGVAISKLITNNIPIVGPLANVGTTYILTKDIGYQCVSDIEKDRMNIKSQSMLSIGRTASTLGAQFISNVSSDGVGKTFESLNSFIDKAQGVIDPKLFSTIKSFKEFLDSTSISSFSKSVLSNTLSDLCQNTLEECAVPNVQESLKIGLISSLCSSVFDNKIAKNEKWYLANKDELIKQQKEAKEFYGNYFKAWDKQIGQEIDKLQKAVGPTERAKALADFDQLVSKMIESLNKSKDYKNILKQRDELFKSAK